MCFAAAIDVVNGADWILAAAAAGIAEIETSVRCVERKVVGSAKRLAVALFGGGGELLAVGRQVQHGVLAGVTNQVRAIGKDLMAVWRAGLSPDRVLAIEREFGDRLVPRDVAIPGVIEADTLAVFGDAEH